MFSTGRSVGLGATVGLAGVSVGEALDGDGDAAPPHA
jgi:hypothetical protein